MMGLKKTNDRLIASLETTMSGLRFSKGPTGLVRIETETGELMAGAIEAPSILDMTPPSTPTREDSGRHGAANRLPMEIVCLVLEFVPKGRQDVFAATSKVSRLWYFASQKFLYDMHIHTHPSEPGR